MIDTPLNMFPSVSGSQPLIRPQTMVDQIKARDDFLTGKSSESAKPASRRKKAAKGPTDIQELAEWLLSSKQRVVLRAGDIEVTLTAVPHVDVPSGTLTLCTWGAEATTITLPPECDVTVDLDDGRVFRGMYLGCGVRLGLRGMISSFSLYA